MLARAVFKTSKICCLTVKKKKKILITFVLQYISESKLLHFNCENVLESVFSFHEYLCLSIDCEYFGHI